MQLNAQPLTPASKDFIDRMILEHQGKPGALLTTLEKIQENDPYRYLSRPVLEYVAQRTGQPLSRIISVVTFYAFFNLEPQGRHTVCVCRGTACHTRGSRQLLESFQEQMGLATPSEEEGGADKISMTTPDREFTLRTVACFGQCALAPVVEIDHNIYGRVDERSMRQHIERLQQEGKK